MDREQEVAAAIMLEAQRKYANRPYKLSHVTPERCMRAAVRALEAEPDEPESVVTARAIEDESRVCGGIILAIIVKVIIGVLVNLAVDYIKRKRAGADGSSWNNRRRSR